jgi:hypothetical protein
VVLVLDATILIIICVLILFLLSYNYSLAIKLSRKPVKDVETNEVEVGDASKSKEMSVRAVKAYMLGDYIVITTVIQKGSSRRSVGEVVIDEPSLLIPLSSSSEENVNGEVQSSP